MIEGQKERRKRDCREEEGKGEKEGRGEEEMRIGRGGEWEIEERGKKRRWERKGGRV